MHVLFIVLALAGDLPGQNPQAISPHPRPVVPQVKPAEPLVGVLEVSSPLPTDVRGSRGDSTGFAGWVFVNGELRGGMPGTQRFLMAPGVYQLRGVMALRNAAGTYFLTVTWPRVVIVQGQVDKLDLAPHFRDFPRRDGTTDVNHWVEPSFEFPRYRVDPANVDAFVRQTVADLAAEWKAYVEEGPFKGVLAAHRALQEAPPPSRPRVWIDVSDRFGGPREFDVAQLRALQEAIMPNIGAWATKMAPYPQIEDLAARARVRAHIDALRAQNETYREYVNAVFDVLVAALEKVGGSR